MTRQGVAGSRELRWYDFITINAHHLGISVLNQTMLPLVLPLLVQQFVGRAAQGAYFGRLRLGGLMVGLLTQAVMGLLSDHCRARWGRRRPFILGGTLTIFLVIVAFLHITAMEGLRGFWYFFGAYLLLQAAVNTSLGAVQGLIPDLVPPEKRSIFSGGKALFEVPLPVILVAFAIAPLISAGRLPAGLLVVSGVLAATLALTMLAPEAPLQNAPDPIDWNPLGRLVFMTGAFTGVILGLGGLVNWSGKLWLAVAGSWPIFLGMGTVGLLAMCGSIVGGVWISIRISLGRSKTSAATVFTWWVINRLAFLVGAFNLSSFVLYFIQARLGLSAEEAAAPASRVMLVVGITLLLAVLPSGWLTDRWGNGYLVTASGLAAGAGTFLLLLAPTLTSIYAGGAIIGLATGVFYTANWAMGVELVPQEEAGRYLGIANLAGAGAGAIGSYIGGPIADYVTLHVPEIPGAGYLLLFFIYGLLFLFSGLLAARKLYRPQLLAR
ncbi:MAG: MFS transporter [Anaerolineae bacterium]|nr:MFS transporter [Anaerolineae bacterium]